jgi:hypothetical protein
MVSPPILSTFSPAGSVFFFVTPIMNTATLSKTCPTCAIKKDASEYFKSRNSKDGLQAHCKSCQAIRKLNKPDINISAAIRADERAVQLIRSAIRVGVRKYVTADGKRINVQREVAKLGHTTSSANFSAVCAGIRGTLQPKPKAQKAPQIEPIIPPIRSISLPPTSVAPTSLATPALIVDLPGIYEVENRGRGTRSFRFESTIDGSVFAFDTFREARMAREKMRGAFEQQSKFDAVQRQSSGKPASDEGDV